MRTRERERERGKTKIEFELRFSRVPHLLDLAATLLYLTSLLVKLITDQLLIRRHDSPLPRGPTPPRSLVLNHRQIRHVFRPTKNGSENNANTPGPIGPGYDRQCPILHTSDNRQQDINNAWGSPPVCMTQGVVVIRRTIKGTRQGNKRTTKNNAAAFAFGTRASYFSPLPQSFEPPPAPAPPKVQNPKCRKTNIAYSLIYTRAVSYP